MASAWVGSGEARKPITHRDMGSNQDGDVAQAVVEDFEQKRVSEAEMGSDIQSSRMSRSILARLASKVGKEPSRWIFN
jgi:hypothetical protein